MISVRFSSRSEAVKYKDSALNGGFMEGERQKKDNGRSCRGDRQAGGYGRCLGRWRCPSPSLPWCSPLTRYPLRRARDTDIFTDRMTSHQSHNWCTVNTVWEDFQRLQGRTDGAFITLVSRLPSKHPPTPPTLCLRAFLCEPPPCSAAYQFTQLLLSSSLSHRARKEQQEVESLSLGSTCLLKSADVWQTHTENPLFPSTCNEVEASVLSAPAKSPQLIHNHFRSSYKHTAGTIQFSFAHAEQSVAAQT